MIIPAATMDIDPSKLALTAMELAFYYPNNDIITGGNQMFITPANRAPCVNSHEHFPCSYPFAHPRLD
jgi:hypothetical protein